MIQPELEVNENVLAQAFGQHLLATNLTSLMLFRAIRNDKGEIQDLQLMYQNQAALESPFLGVLATVGQKLTEEYPNTKTVGQFYRYVEVIETGIPFAAVKHYADKDQTFHIAATKYEDGLILSYYNLTEKQLAERKSQQQAQVLQTILDSSQDAIIVWEPLRNQECKIIDFKAYQFNQASFMDGVYSQEDYYRLTLTQISPGASKYIPQYAQVIETGTPLRIERHIQRGGRDLWLDISVTKLGDKMLAIYKNISPYRKATLELEARNQLLDGILDSSDNIIFLAEAERDQTGTIVDFRISKGNKLALDGFREAFGIDVIGISILELVGKAPELLDEAINVVETGVPLVLEQRYSSDTDRWHKVSLKKLNNGLVATYVDVTAIQKALLDVQHQKELIEGVLDSSINGVYAMEPILNEQEEIIDFRILMVNQAAAKFSNLSPDEQVGSRYLSLFPSVKDLGFFNQYVEAISQNKPFRAEMSFPSPDGTHTFWYDMSLVRMKNGLVILSFLDITERMLLHQKQESLLEELRQSNVDLEQFAYVASHDLQEPARKITLFSDMLTRQYASQLPPSGAELTGRIQVASSRMQELINGLLTYSRFSSHKLDPEIVSLDAVILDVLQDLETSIDEKEARITVRKLPRIKGNPIQLHQLFLNLISNALKFSKEGAIPEIIVEAGPATEEELAETVSGRGRRWVAIRVKDNGIGFEPTYRKQVFEIFKRLHGRTQYAGNGLGLAICKKVAELHGGGITTFSTPDLGTTFVVVLPVYAH
ncbi:PAS domain-containing sensor histidine kinase [Telluribacter humicola]|uniref:PAS domain-containing sensor histidine kinase n=1 Tax=Telluribacter humicola TaxID=1720261 RepID=UPI001A9667DB|nr:ATP-binding protein [Telluribacter humicola]